MLIDFYQEVLGPPAPREQNPLRYSARKVSGRSAQEAFTSNGSPEAMVSEQWPTAWMTPGRGVDGSAH